MAQLSTGIAEFTMGRWSGARDQLQKAEEIFRSQCTGVAWELDTAHAFELWARIYAGDFNNMSQRTASLLKEGLERGDKNAVTTLGTFMVPHIDWCRTIRQARRRWRSISTLARAATTWHLTGLMSLSYIDRIEAKAARLIAPQAGLSMG